MQAYILLVPVEGNNRHDVDCFDGVTFEDTTQAIGTIRIAEAQLLTLGDFVTTCNDEEINLDEHWVSYICIKEEKE